MATQRAKPTDAAAAQSSTARRAVENAVSEKEWQQQVIDLAQLLGWAYFHTHDSRRSPAGFPDLVLIRDRVIFAELKREGGTTSNRQREILYALHLAGAEAYVWRPSDWPEVERTLTRRVER